MISTVIVLFIEMNILVICCNCFKIDQGPFDLKINTKLMNKARYYSAGKKTYDSRRNLYLHGFEHHLLDHGILTASVDILQQASGI